MDQEQEIMVVLPEQVHHYHSLKQAEKGGALGVGEAEVLAQLGRDLMLNSTGEDDPDSIRPKIDYDQLTEWPFEFDGEVLKDSRGVEAPVVTLLMVVKNEAETLRAAVESVRPIVDEVIIGVDDSCTDDTESIATELADLAFRFRWRRDFAWARNNALTQTRGQWVMILDGHEELDHASLPMVRILTEGAKEDISILMGVTVMNPRSPVEQGSVFSQPRLFRRLPKHFYKYDTHHQIAGSKDCTRFCPEIRIYHMMPHDREMDRAKQRGDMNIRNLVRLVSRDPLDERAIFYLANTYHDAGEPKAASAWYNYHLTISKQDPFKYHSRSQLASIALGQEDFKTAREHLYEAHKLCWYRAETLVALGAVSEHQGNLGEAEHWYKQAVNIKVPEGSALFLRQECYTWLPWRLLAGVYEKQSQWEQALSAIEKALEYDPQNHEALGLHRWYYRNINQRKRTGGARVVLFDHIGSFTPPIIHGLVEKGHQVTAYKYFDTRLMEGADVAFFEWGSENIIRATHFEWDIPIVLRIHRYEPYGNYLPGINWSRVQHVIFTSRHIQEVSNQAVEIPQTCAQHIIPSSIDLARWDYKNREPNKKIAFVGYLNWKKGIPILLQALRKIRDHDPDYTLYVLGKTQTQEVEHYAFEMGRRLGVHDNIHWTGWQADVNAALDKYDTSYIINTSLTEGCPYSVLEGMAKGLRPIVHRWPGAEHIFPSEWLFATPEEVIPMLDGINSSAYREFVETHHSGEIELQRFMEILGIEEVSKDVGDAVASV